MKNIEMPEMLDVLANHFKMTKPEVFAYLRDHFTTQDLNTLYGVFTELRKQKLEPDAILGYVSEYFSIPVDVITSPLRKREVVDARNTSMYIIKHVTDTTLEEIAAMHGRVHTTALRTKKVVNNLIDTDEKFKSTILTIGKNLLEIHHQGLYLTSWIHEVFFIACITKVCIFYKIKKQPEIRLYMLFFQ